MDESTGNVPRPSATLDVQIRLYRLMSISLCAAFGAVGILFLTIPGDVIVLFNSLSRLTGMAEATVAGRGFYLILAVGYMYVVSYLAWRMYRVPTEIHPLQVLVQAKSASSVLSFVFFIVVQPCFMFLANALVDGAIAGGLVLVRVKWKGIWQ